MEKYKGLSFPYIFNSDTGVTNVVSGLEKIKSDVRLLISTRLHHTLFNPDMGINLDAILFADDYQITRDFIYSFVSDALLKDLPEVRVTNVSLEYPSSEFLKIYLSMIYEATSDEFNIDVTVGGGLNG